MQRNNSQSEINILVILFFLSGISALIYQIAWQRLLFANLGSDIESVTIIVSVFMLGLGLGSLVGGRLVDKFPERAIILFAFSEIGIGSFGIFSKSIILASGEYFHSEKAMITVSLSFFIFIFPTLLMGATLPILVTYLVKRWSNVGAATGHMYAFNTLGAAVGAFVAGYWLFDKITLLESTYLAAVINICIAIFALIFFRGRHA